MPTSTPKIIKEKTTIVTILFKGLPKSLLQIVPTPSAGIEKPPIINATILAIGIKTIAGRKTIA